MVDKDKFKEEFDETIRREREELEQSDEGSLDIQIDGMAGSLKERLQQELRERLEEEKKKLTSFIAKRYISRWLKGLAAGGFVPLAGIIPSFTAFIWWFAIKIANIEVKGVRVDVNIYTSLFVWAAVMVQFFSVLIILVILYIIVNPLEVGLDALGL
ncbi:hypothetical protein ISR92_02345 [Patescibacteria group bacterium]|nr:hypothetical protein [Patescibacteria group bacterium]